MPNAFGRDDSVRFGIADISESRQILKGKYMSSIGSLSGTDSSSLIDLIKQFSVQSQSSTVAKTVDQTDSTGTNDQGIDALKSIIDSAVSEALKKLDKSASADQIMQAIKSAADGVLEANGVNPEEMKGGMRSPVGNSTEAPLPPPNGQGGQDDFMTKIEALLQQNGFDVEKFKSEMAAKMAQHTGNTGLEALNSLSSTQGINTQA
jgi:hypothetical protein